MMAGGESLIMVTNGCSDVTLAKEIFNEATIVMAKARR